MKETEILTGPRAYQEAERRAVYGHKRYICWDENETGHAARLTSKTLKRAMLAMGTQGQFYITPSFGIFGWHVACNILRELKSQCR